MGHAIFSNQIRQLLDAPAARIPALRAEAVERLRRARDPFRYVQTMLDRCVARRSEGGLDFAIDILSQAEDLPLEYALEFCKEDSTAWGKENTIGYRPNDDVWFVLLRSAARARANPLECLALMHTCLAAGSRGMREAVVEGLYDLRTAEAKQLLSRIAAEDTDPLIRKLADDNLHDLEALEQ